MVGRSAGKSVTRLKSSADLTRTKRSLAPETALAPELPVDIFKGLSPDERKTVIAAAERVRFAKGRTIYTQGERHEGVFVIQSGVIRTFYVSPGGREFTVAFWRVGNLGGTPDLFGDSHDSVYRWSGVATTPVEILIFRPGKLRVLIERIPRLAIGIIEALEMKIRYASVLVQMLGTMRVHERLHLCLRTLAEVHGVQSDEGIVLCAPFTHESIASMVGASRQWVTLELNKMQRAGIIKLGRNSLTILHPEQLERDV
jgi:CRP/FNR family transcriptional regulator, cyclic AMP receptor protein